MLDSLNSAQNKLQALQTHLKSAKMRACVVFSGTQAWQNHLLSVYLKDIEHGLWVGEMSPYPCLTPVKFQDAKHYLGQETDCVVFSEEEGIEPNSLGILGGMIKAGGLCIILLPAYQDWIQCSNPAMQKYLNTPYTLEDTRKGFNLFLWQKLQQSAFWFEEDKAGFTLHELTEQFKPFSSNPIALPTLDQQQAIKAIERVALGHRNRPLVIQANRGRGKSYCLGLAALHLIELGKTNIVFTAARPQQAQQALALIEAAGASDQVQFIPPDQLIRTPIKPDILLVDEAAHLPLPMLEKLIKTYHRLVLATTTQGYEGSGKGFELKLSELLTCLHWKQITLETPIRWQIGDLLEQTLQSLFFNTSIKAMPDVSAFKIQPYTSEQLLEDASLLSALFELMSQVHYQTTPNDLMQWLEMPNLKFWIATAEEKLVGAVIAVEEGGLEEAMPVKRGHLVPRWLAKQYHCPQWLALKSLRVMRIAVLPQYQNKGVGSKLLSTLMQTQTYDYLSASFGCTVKLTQFWQKQQFEMVGLGLKKDKASGLHSQFSVLACHETSKRLLKQARHEFKAQLSHQLMADFNRLNASLVMAIVRQLNYESADCFKTDFPKGYLTDQPYEAISYQLRNWLLSHPERLDTLPKEAAHRLIQTILQNHPWQNKKQSELELKGLGNL